MTELVEDNLRFFLHATGTSAGGIQFVSLFCKASFVSSAHVDHVLDRWDHVELLPLCVVKNEPSF